MSSLLATKNILCSNSNLTRLRSQKMNAATNFMKIIKHSQSNISPSNQNVASSICVNERILKNYPITKHIIELIQKSASFAAAMTTK